MRYLFLLLLVSGCATIDCKDPDWSKSCYCDSNVKCPKEPREWGRR